MAAGGSDGAKYEQLILLVRAARGLERQGQYNAAKLFWAAAFSEEVQASEAYGIPSTLAELMPVMESAIGLLTANGARPEMLDAFETAREAVRQDSSIAFGLIPYPYVCRECGHFMLGVSPHRCPACGARELTLREFPAAYYLEPLRPLQAVEALAATPITLASMVSGLSEEQLRQTPGPGEWAVQDALLHLLGTEGILAGRVAKMLAEDNPSLASVSPAEVAVQEDLSGAEILERFSTSRRELVERLLGLSAEDWWRTGRHLEFGEVTILQQASYFAKHDQSHLPQIDAIRQAIGA